MSSSTLRRARGLLVAAAVVAGVAGPAASPAVASTITVTTTSDTLVTDGSCSIREAIINANDDAATWPDCAAGSGADTITLPAGSIVLASGRLDILSSMTIVGTSGPPATPGTWIDGGLLDRVFDINPDPDGLPETPSITVNISTLQISRGQQDEAGAVRINARATVTIDRVTISNSKALAGDGGAIYVFADGALTLTHSTIALNQALLGAAGVKSEGSLTVVSSTITANATSAMTPDRGQGLGCTGRVCTTRNTIIAGNGIASLASPPPSPRGDTEGVITSLGYNIIGKTTDSTGNPLTVITPTTGDQFGVPAAALNLFGLATFGGPTMTIALNPGSIAIDAGHSSGAATDQRGLPRPCDQAGVANAPGGDGADIGAFEVQVASCVAPGPPNAVADLASFQVNSGLHTIDVLANDTDPDGDALTITSVTQSAHGVVVNNGSSVSYIANVNFIGTDPFTYTIDDGHGHTDTATVIVLVGDIGAPTLTVTTRVSSLWPPDHQLENVGLRVSASDDSGLAPAIQVKVFSDEDDLAPGSGHFSPDARDIAPDTLRLRSERSESGGGRVYLIVVTATDASNNASHECAAVVVPVRPSAAALAAAEAAGAAAARSCNANNGAPPAGFVVVGDGPLVGRRR
jgi:Bacterial Ig domain